MTNEQTAMFLYPPGLSDEEAFAVGEFLQVIEDHEDVHRVWAAVR